MFLVTWRNIILVFLSIVSLNHTEPVQNNEVKKKRITWKVFLGTGVEILTCMLAHAVHYFHNDYTSLLRLLY